MDHESCDVRIILVKRGNLFKWTNYLSGWQCRYVVVERGTLSYYRNELDMEFGCRGVIHLGRLFILVLTTLSVLSAQCRRIPRSPGPGPRESTTKVVRKANKLRLKLLNMILIHRDLIYFYQTERRGISGSFFSMIY